MNLLLSALESQKKKMIKNSTSKERRLSFAVTALLGLFLFHKNDTIARSLMRKAPALQVDSFGHKCDCIRRTSQGLAGDFLRQMSLQVTR